MCHDIDISSNSSLSAVPNTPSGRLEIAEAVRSILTASGEDPKREGLRDTPMRVAKMYEEIFAGLRENAYTHLQTQFAEDNHQNAVIVRDIEFFSMCEHHLVPFFGKAHVAYIPDEGRLTGLSKIARVVQVYARRPQLQERLNTQVVNAIWEVLRPKGVLAVVEAQHLCMAMRGVKALGSSTTTVVARGVLETDAVVRAEILSLMR